MIVSIVFTGLLAISANAADLGELPDFTKIGGELDRRSEAKQFVDLAKLFASSNERLHSSLLKLYEASAWADGGHAEEAVRALEQAFDYGLKNPNVVTKYPSLGGLKSHPAWAGIEGRIKRLRDQMSDVEHFQVHTEDAVAFWKAYERARDDRPRAREIFGDWILSGSPALRDYYANRYMSVDNLVQTTLVTYPKYYEALYDRFEPARLDSIKEQTIANMKRFRTHYPRAIFPHGYLMIGVLNSAGSVTELGVFIGLDMYKLDDGISLEELPDGLKRMIGDPGGIPGTLTHELMHFQQSYRDPIGGVLLRKVFEEGACDFLTELSSAKPGPEGTRQRYFREHEAHILDEFRHEMNGTDLSKWMYNGSRDGRPADLGYTLGYVLSKSYYERAADKKHAVDELLNTNRFMQLIEEGQYKAALTSKTPAQ
ncbi:DUF2268 domain-containing putative Zn-dependent protease [Singulisphaera rosea]